MTRHTLAPQLRAVIGLWANATTGDGLRKRDLLRDKQHVLDAFFTFVQQPPAQVDAGDIAAWQRHLEAENYAPATVYAMISRVSSFYEWAIKEPQLARVIRANPVRLARPKAPIPYQGESTKALSLEDVQAIFAEIRNHFGSTNDAERLWRNVDYTAQRRKGGSAQPAEQPLTSHGFVQRLKRYATAAGVHHIHLHQTRHTFAAWVGEETGDYRAVQAALGHQDLRTTFIYAQRLGVRRDNVSAAIAQKLELPPLPIETDGDQE